MSDFTAQIFFVSAAVERILSQINPEPLSPFYGCAHLAYWRDKTSAVADTRRQEVMFALALLYKNDYPGSEWKLDKRLKKAIEALIIFWCRNQYNDGTFDEWYKGERAFAAAAFSAHAVARTIEIMGDDLPAECVLKTKGKLGKTAKWLLKNNDLFKTNHQAVGAAALAWAGKVIENNDYTRGAREKIQSIIDVQNEEGWFPEIGQMDLGYTFLTVEFVSMVMVLWGSFEYLEPFKRAFDFACGWVHPDLTVGNEYGICHNSYLSRIATVIMSAYSGRAAYLMNRLKNENTGFAGISPVLTDDLRLLRWAFQPLLAYEYLQRFEKTRMAKPEPIPLADSNCAAGKSLESSIIRFSCGEGTGIISGVSGGLVRMFGSDKGNIVSDFGYALKVKDGFITNNIYNSDVKVQKKNNDYFIRCNFLRVKKFMPSFWARVILHIACSIRSGSKLTRTIIDVIRKKKQTSINQTSGSIVGLNPNWILERQLSIKDYELVIIDTLYLKEMVRTDAIYFLESTGNNWSNYNPIHEKLAINPKTCRTLKIEKRYRFEKNWKLVGIAVL